jgi:uncharacterized phage-associated protein
MNEATLVVYKTGLFYDNLKKWDVMPVAHKTYKEFCNHILEAQQVYHRQQQTSKQSGYGLAIQEIHELAENFANTAAIDQTEKAAIDAAQKDLITALTMQVEMLTKQNREILAKLNLPPVNFATIPATGAPSNTALR